MSDPVPQDATHYSQCPTSKQRLYYKADGEKTWVWGAWKRAWKLCLHRKPDLTDTAKYHVFTPDLPAPTEPTHGHHRPLTASGDMIEENRKLQMALTNFVRVDREVKAATKKLADRHKTATNRVREARDAIRDVLIARWEAGQAPVDYAILLDPDWSDSFHYWQCRHMPTLGMFINRQYAAINQLALWFFPMTDLSPERLDKMVENINWVLPYMERQLDGLRWFFITPNMVFKTDGDAINLTVYGDGEIGYTQVHHGFKTMREALDEVKTLFDSKDQTTADRLLRIYEAEQHGKRGC